MIDSSAAKVFVDVAIAFGLGFLVGLQRESRHSPIAGIRTFPLVSVLGTLSALLAAEYGGWILGAGILAVTALLVLSNVMLLKRPEPADPGMTTEVAFLLMYVVGAVLAFGYRELAIAVGGGVAVILQFKGPLHRFTAGLEEDDVRAIMRFVLLTLVILPVLPNRTFGPYDVLNPRQVWWMVVLIVGIGLGGYIAHKFLGERLGHALAGVFGGLVSSTATTATYARRVARLASKASGAPQPSSASVREAVLVVVVASAVAIVRIHIEIAAVAPALLRTAVPALAFVLLPLAAASLRLWRKAGGAAADRPIPSNPSELGTALVFGALYAGILVATQAAKESFGDRGTAIVAALSGLTDVDALTLSSARLFEINELSAQGASRLIVIAASSNLAFKGLLAAAIGGRAFGKGLFLPFGLAIVGAGLAFAAGYL